MTPFFDPEAHRIQVNLRLRHGTFTDQERKDIVSALEGIPFGEVRIDEAIVFNLGIGAGGGPGLPINIDVWLHIGEGAASGLLTLAIAKAVAPIVKVIRKRVARLVTVIHEDRISEPEPITYVVDPPDELEAVEGIPADYEVTIRTESRTQVWRDGRWESYDSTTKEERGT